MTDLEDAAEELAAGEEERQRKVAGMKTTPLQRHDLIGAAFRPGQLVRDKATGQSGNVIQSNFLNVLTPSSGKGLIKVPTGEEHQVHMVRLADGRVVARSTEELEEQKG